MTDGGRVAEHTSQVAVHANPSFVGTSNATAVRLGIVEWAAVQRLFLEVAALAERVADDPRPVQRVAPVVRGGQPADRCGEIGRRGREPGADPGGGQHRGVARHPDGVGALRVRLDAGESEGDTCRLRFFAGVGRSGQQAHVQGGVQQRRVYTET